ncbi:Type I inositol 1,4,5-trisphosphate 5-phosphatase [Takifugu flavidus]|uniref:Type I inositol 1,4,5-trisphosphate 5-phosphatase n=1 Tax=Takifugu flavidus TaxID=433684 RepID=A0A5C6PDZ2_9TELE|nr:Type I inositol 1,4,5-trisphosphate 5-phosphatase [Takifugu flavidus]
MSALGNHHVNRALPSDLLPMLWSSRQNRQAVALWPTGTEGLWVRGHRREMVEVALEDGRMFACQLMCSSCAHVPSSLPRITDQRYEKVPYFVFGDFNFRLDSKRVIEVSFFDCPLASA